MGYVNIGREALGEFQAGQGSVSIFPLPVLAANLATAVQKYVIIRAVSGNSGNLYVGPSTVAVGAGWILDANDETPPIHIDSLAKIYIVSDQSGTNEVQTVSIDTNTDNGTITLSFNGQGPTASIDYDADAAAVKSALEGLSNIDLVSVTGGPGPGTDWIIEFQGQNAAQNVVLMTGSGSNAGRNEVQTVAIDTDTDNGTITLSFDGQGPTAGIAYDATAADIKAALELLTNIDLVSVTGGPGPGTDWLVEFQGTNKNTDVALMTGSGSNAGRNEVQTVAIDNASSSGTFTLTFDGQGPTTGIDWNADATAVKSALEGLSNIDLVAVTGGPGPSTDWIVEFQGINKNTDVVLMTGDGTNLVGGSTTVTITETTAGIATTVTVTETTAGIATTVGITETTPGDPAAQSYSWLAV